MPYTPIPYLASTATTAALLSCSKLLTNSNDFKQRAKHGALYVHISDTIRIPFGRASIAQHASVLTGIIAGYIGMEL